MRNASPWYPPTIASISSTVIGLIAVWTISPEMPKAELHLHLEGSVEPETLHEFDPGTPGRFPRALPVCRFRRLPEGLRRNRQAAARTRGLRAGYAAPAGTAGRPERAVRRDHSGGGVVLWKGQEFAPIFDAVRQAAAGSP